MMNGAGLVAVYNSLVVGEEASILHLDWKTVHC